MSLLHASPPACADTTMQSFPSVAPGPSAADTPFGDLMLPGPAPAAAAIKRSIARRLLFWFLMIALIPCAILTAITAQIASSALENSIREVLVRTAASKAGELESYAQERLRDGRALAGEPDVIRAARELGSITAAAGTAEATTALREGRWRRHVGGRRFSCPCGKGIRILAPVRHRCHGADRARNGRFAATRLLGTGRRSRSRAPCRGLREVTRRAAD
jgi:hypothetical protein